MQLRREVKAAIQKWLSKPPLGVDARWRFWVLAAIWFVIVSDMFELLAVLISRRYDIKQLRKHKLRVLRALTDGVTVLAVAILADLGEIALDAMAFFEQRNGLRASELHEHTDYVWARLLDAKSDLLSMMAKCTAEELAESDKVVKAWQNGEWETVLQAMAREQRKQEKKAVAAAAAAAAGPLRRSRRQGAPSGRRLEVIADGVEPMLLDEELASTEAKDAGSALEPAAESVSDVLTKLREAPWLEADATSFRVDASVSTGISAIAPPLAHTSRRIDMAKKPGLARAVAGRLGLAFLRGYARKLHYKGDKLYRSPYLLAQLNSPEFALAQARKLVSRGRAALQKEAADTVGHDIDDVRAAALDPDYHGPLQAFFDDRVWQLLVDFAKQSTHKTLSEHGGELHSLYLSWWAAWPTSTAWLENTLKKVKALKPQQRWNLETASRQLRLAMKDEQLLIGINHAEVGAVIVSCLHPVLTIYSG